jgi:hypothetical protein
MRLFLPTAEGNHRTIIGPKLPVATHRDFGPKFTQQVNDQINLGLAGSNGPAWRITQRAQLARSRRCECGSTSSGMPIQYPCIWSHPNDATSAAVSAHSMPSTVQEMPSS